MGSAITSLSMLSKKRLLPVTSTQSDASISLRGLLSFTMKRVSRCTSSASSCTTGGRFKYVLEVCTANTYLNLPPVVQLLAEDVHRETRFIVNESNPRKLIDASDWVLVTGNKRFLDNIDSDVMADPIDVPPGLRVWTDDYNNLFQILRPVRFNTSAPR